MGVTKVSQIAYFLLQLVCFIIRQRLSADGARNNRLDGRFDNRIPGPGMYSSSSSCHGAEVQRSINQDALLSANCLLRLYPKRACYGVLPRRNSKASFCTTLGLTAELQENVPRGTL
jgi:hypothetical protein